MTSTIHHGDLGQHSDLPEHGDLPHHGDFDPEQAAMLQDLARSGAPEAQMYGYPEVGANSGHLNGYPDNTSNDMHSNGVLPVNGLAYYPDFTYAEAGLLQSQQDLDLDDPAALLESLANFEHPPTNSNAPISNDHFASLLQAAATAGGEEAARVDLGRTRRSTRQSKAMEEPHSTQIQAHEARSRRSLNDKSIPPENHGFVTKGNKRKRVLDETDEEEQLRREREIWGPEEPEEEDPFHQEPQYEHPPIATSEARAVGVHSAAALFRRPSSASKKYTRPPMSKLFTSLELTPEQFLHLQAAAKIYMLDPNFPERRDCVGNRGRTDTDMVKLKLFGCVKSFLEDEGWGERCFGNNAEGAESRKLRWPQMKNKVISLVTPLLRRMVTNERQRQYAVETRKSSGTTPSAGKVTNRKARDVPDTPSTTQESTSRYPDIDPKLDQYHYNLDPSFASNAADEPSDPPRIRPSLHGVSAAQEPFPASPLSENHIQYHVNILHNGVRIRPKLNLFPSSCPAFSSLVQHVRGVLSDDSSIEPTTVQILCPDGLRNVGDSEETWQDTVKSVVDCVWMDGQVRVLVEVRYQD